MKKFLLILILIFSTSLNAKTFKEVLHLYEFQIKTYLKKHNIESVSQITPVNIDKTLKSGFWPNHWPFAVGISDNKAFWVTFKRLGMVEINPIINKNFNQLSAINGTKDGQIIIADNKENKLHIIQLDKMLSNYTIKQTIQTPSPKSIKINKNNTLAVLGDNSISIYNRFKKSYKLNKEFSKKLAEKISKKSIQAINYDSKNNLYVLVDNKIHIYNKVAEKIKTITLDKNINAFGITYHKNIIGISSKDNMLYTFSKNGNLLHKKQFPKFKNNNNVKFTFFPPFAYVGLYSNLEGYAYNMGLDIIDFRWLKKIERNKKEFSFTSTFPAKMTISISDQNNKPILTIIDNKILTAKKHTFKFTLPQNDSAKSYTLSISGKALYSQSNTKTKIIEFKNK